ncbi:ALF repeat-containing protein [Streptomyces sp. NPDC000405]|uniref:ALF repeat-containing protein n=1 Tax=Streptomyces sp. NPDC000405 TaxID=3161033 RepID=UPI00398CBC19
MNRQWRVAQAVMVALLGSGGVVAGVAPPQAVGAVPAVVPATDQAADGQPVAEGLTQMRAAAKADARNRVLYYAKYHPAAEVRASAWNALRSARGDEAIAEWLAPGGGFDYAKQLARNTRARNKAFCERVVSTHPKEFSPEVRAAAERALKGTDADRAAFVKTGYAEAQQRDRTAREADAQRKVELAAKDRELVRSLAEHDPGEQVRVAAQWALRPGATDVDVAEFFGYGWSSGGVLDLEAYRLRVADGEAMRHAVLSQLIAKAAAAEEAGKGAADAAKARAEAAAAWKAVSEHADAAQRAWLAEQEAAAAQAENWQNIAKAAKESADSLWKNIGQSAETNQTSWTQERSEAAKSAGFWKDMFDRAQDAESRVKD